LLVSFSLIYKASRLVNQSVILSDTQSVILSDTQSVSGSVNN